MPDQAPQEKKGSAWVRCVGLSSRVPGTSQSVLFADLDGHDLASAKDCGRHLLRQGFSHVLGLRTTKGHHVLSFDVRDTQALLEVQEDLVQRGWQDARHAEQLRNHGRNVLRVSRKGDDGQGPRYAFAGEVGPCWVWSVPHRGFYESLVGDLGLHNLDPAYGIGQALDVEVYYTPRRVA